MLVKIGQPSQVIKKISQVNEQGYSIIFISGIYI